MDSLIAKHHHAAVCDALENLPKGVDDTYDEAMSRIEQQREDDRELAKQVLSWVCYARRPLTIDELQHALAVIPGMTNSDDEYLIETEILTSACAGLVI